MKVLYFVIVKNFNVNDHCEPNFWRRKSNVIAKTLVKKTVKVVKEKGRSTHLNKKKKKKK